MGDYAASIRVSTKIDTKDMSKLDSAFAKVAERAAIAKDKVEALDKAGTPHNAEIYQKSVAELDKLNRELDKVKGNVKKVESQSELSKIKGSFSSLSDEVEDYSTRLKDLRDKGYGPGDQVFDDVYKGWKNAQYAEEEYFKSLNSKTDKGIAEQAAKIAQQKEKEAQIQAKAREREIEQQRRIEAAAEKNLQTVNAQLEKEAQIQAKQQAKEAEERRLSDIKKNAIVSDHKMVALLQEQIVLQQRLAELKQAGVTSGYQEYDEITNKLKHIDIKLKDTQTGFQKISKAARKGFSGVGGILKSVQNGIQKIGSLAKRVFKRFNDDAKKSNGFLSIMKSRLGGIALSLLVFNWITRGFNAMMTGMKEGLQNLARYSKDYNAVMSDMVSALAALKNSFATAFAPVASIVIPFLTQLINVLTSAVNKVAQFIAALTGKTTWTRAKKQNIDYAESLDKVSKTAKEAYRSLADFDELTVLSKNGTADSDIDAINPGDMFEEVAIDSKIKEFADKVKKILAKLFAPLKEAWKREGKFVMDSWKYALDEVGKLLKDIGRDFLEVWNQEATIKIFQDILHIVGDIGLIVGNLAANFRKAWNENQIGKKILENIRDLFGIIVANFRHAADYMVEWSKTINFTPLLNAFEKFTDSLKPVVDFLSGVLTDFLEDVLAPLSKWVVEKGLPELLIILQDFCDKVDWAGLRDRLKEFWTHLEPFAEKIGEGLLLFIRELSEALADFLNSPAFESFLTSVEKWMDNVKPEDVANGLKIICAALVGYEVVSAVASGFKAAKDFLDIFKIGGTAAQATKVMGEASTAIGGLQSNMLLLGFAFSVVEGIKLGNFNNELGKLIESCPKREDFNNLEDFNEALANHGEKLETLSKTRYDTTSIDNFWESVSGKKIERDENGKMQWLNDLENSIVSFFTGTEEKAKESGANTATVYNQGFSAGAIEIAKTAGDIKTKVTQSFDDITNKSSSSSTVMQSSMSTLATSIANSVSGILCSLQSFNDKTVELKKSIKDLLESDFERLAGIGLMLGGAAASIRSARGYSYSAAGYRMPALATGGITTGTTIAKIGEAGREAVLPLERNTGWMDTLANKINGGGDMAITVNLDGREIYRNVVERSQIARSSGRPAFDF